MRLCGWLAVLLSLCACDRATPPPADRPAPDADYRYAYRLPTQRIKAVQDSHAAGCDRLGAAHCRVSAVRYSVADAGVTAALRVTIDPVLARAFGQAATRTVVGAHGVLLDSDLAAGERGEPVLIGLRAALASAESAARAGDPAAAAKAGRLRAAVATIAEIDPAAASSVATSPMLFTYASGAPEPSFAAAGPALLDSLGGLAVILAGVGPWLVLLLGGALLLRRFIQPRGSRDDTPPPATAHPEPENRSNVIRRWFQREPENVD